MKKIPLNFSIPNDQLFTSVCNQALPSSKIKKQSCINPLMPC